MRESEAIDLAEVLAQPDFKSIEPKLIELDKHLILRTYLDGYQIKPADIKVWTVCRTNKVVYNFLKRGTMINVARWFNFIEATHPEIQTEIQAADLAQKEKNAIQSRAGASYNLALQNTEKGVCTRFPPEPS
jgi:glutamyl-tRNA synthetase